jgi:hypothetical protein
MVMIQLEENVTGDDPSSEINDAPTCNIYIKYDQFCPNSQCGFSFNICLL